MKILLSTLGVATLAFTISACSTGAANSSTTANTANKNTAVVVNNNQTANASAVPAASAKPANANAAKPAANTAKAAPADSATSENVSGELQTGKTESVILYVGMETGDYAAYCFKNDSDAGRAILAKCKNGEQCELKATFDEGGATCKVPGLEASLSASFNIAKVGSVKSLGRGK